MSQTEPSFPSPRLVRFGVFQAELDSGELRKNGLKIKLQDQPFQILAMLLERPGEVVTREELRQKLWPADTFVDFDHSLNAAVKKLRQALGDSADNPRFVETLARRGYRFITPVQTGSDSQPVERVAPDTRSLFRLSKAKAWTVASGIIVLAIVTVFSYWLSRSSSQPKLLGSSPVTDDRHRKLEAHLQTRMVTDGYRLYFTEVRDNKKVIVEVSTGGGETIPIATALQNPEVEDLSLDGSKLLVTSSRAFEEDRSFWVLPLPSGSPYRLGDLRGQSPSLSPDGQSLVYARGSDLRMANSHGTGDRKLATVSGRPWWLRWSPDGTRIRFTVDEEQSFVKSLWEIAPDGTGLRPVLSGWNDPPDECCGSWTPDGKYFLFESTRNFSTNVWVVRDKAGFLGKASRDPVQLTTGPMNFHRPLASRDGRRLFVVGDLRRGELSRYDKKMGRWLTYLPGLSAETLAFSSDGRFISYVSIPEGTLWKSKVDDTQRQQLTFRPMMAIRPQWSPDSKEIAFTALKPGEGSAIYSISAEGGIPQDLVPNFPNAGDLSWSPDGRSLIFGTFPRSKSEVDEAAIYLLDRHTRKISKLPGSDGYYSPHWSPEGRYVHGLKLSSNELVVFDFTTKKWEVLTNFPVKHHESSRDGKYIYFESIFIQDPAILRVRAGDTAVEKVVSVRDLRRTSNLFMPWAGLTLDDSPLIALDVGSQEIYALDWEAP